MLYSGEFFPSVDSVIELIERRRQAERDQKPDEWAQWKAELRKAEAEGRMATDAEYQELREVFRRIVFGPKAISLPAESDSKAASGVVHGSLGGEKEDVAGNTEVRTGPAIKRSGVQGSAELHPEVKGCQ